MTSNGAAWASQAIAITGLGPVTPVGIGVEAFWQSLLAGKSGIGKISQFDTADFPVSIAAEVDFDADTYLDRRQQFWLDRFSQFALAAAKLAVDHAHSPLSALSADRVGVVIGTGIGGLSQFEREYASLATKGPRAVSPGLVARTMPNAASAAVSMFLKLSGPSDCTVTACASGAHAIARAAELIRSDRADAVLAGGTEAAITPLALASFWAARALSAQNDAAASKPFDRRRDGFVMGEGAAVLLLESLRSAQERGAEILGLLLGHGISSDAYHFVAPHPEGAGAAAAIRSALADAHLTPGDVNYVNAHATATPVGDAAEAAAITSVFGDSPPPVSAAKSMTGHLMGASGATEAVATVLTIANQVAPPTINFQEADPACPLDVIPNCARPMDIEIALSNSFGFGGHNVTLVFGGPSLLEA